MTVNLKTESEAKLFWLLAGILFIVCEGLAVTTFFATGHRNHFQFHPNAVGLPITAFIPWFVGRLNLRRYRLLDEERVEAAVRSDFSYQMAVLVISAYVLFSSGMAINDLMGFAR